MSTTDPVNVSDESFAGADTESAPQWGRLAARRPNGSRTHPQGRGESPSFSWANAIMCDSPHYESGTPETD
jgi:hypothetical protein